LCVYGPERRAPPTDVRHGGTHKERGDPAPLSACQLRVLAKAVARELVWGLPAVAREVRAWRARALTIPDAPIRTHALTSLAHKRGNIDGAALFWTLPRNRNHTLVALLASYEMICDFLDSINEPPVASHPDNGRQLHRSLIEALDFNQPLTSHYLHHPCRADGGYLRSLVCACRVRCAALPAYERVHDQLKREATRFEIIAINHDTLTSRREMTHRSWAAREFPNPVETSWFEMTAAATASLTIHALLALSAEPAASHADLRRARDAYSPWITLTTTMLDHFVDRAEDEMEGNHSYVAYYPNPETATQRIHELINRSLREANTLQHGERHILIAACMVAMYLSKDSARTLAMRPTTKTLTAAGGSLTRLLVPILRLWRITYGQRST
jgi:tetraprenyl-beta-curcumene synthase